MCKIYYFVWHMSYTASISILTVIAMERYVAIIHPLKARTLITPMKLKIAQAVIWLIAAGYNIPYLIIFDTVYIGEFVYCFPKLNTLDMKAMSAAELVVWYTVPLSLMIFMYTRISVTLWRTTKNETFRMKKVSGSSKQRLLVTSASSHSSNGGKKKGYISNDLQNGRIVKPNDSMLVKSPLNMEPSMSNDKGCNDKHNSCDDVSKSSGSDILNQTEIEDVSTKCRNSDDSRCRVAFNYHATSSHPHRMYRSEEPKINKKRVRSNHKNNNHSNTKTTVLGRKKVIRLLLAIVISFAICVLPHHIRLFIHYWDFWESPLGTELVSPISFVILYLNSALNPILYALFSEHFRKSFKESLDCRTSTTKKKRTISFSQDSGSKYGNTIITHT